VKSRLPTGESRREQRWPSRPSDPRPGQDRLALSARAKSGGPKRVGCDLNRRLHPVCLKGEIRAAARRKARFRAEIRQLLTSCLCRFSTAFLGCAILSYASRRSIRGPVLLSARRSQRCAPARLRARCGTLPSRSEPLRPPSNLPDGLARCGNKSAKPLLHGLPNRWDQASAVLCEATGVKMCLSMQRASASSVFWTATIARSRMMLATAGWQSSEQDLRERRFVV
jgi:hypothetical protein